MAGVTKAHFLRAATDIGAHGDNDTLPFDVDNKFIKDCVTDLATIAYQFASRLSRIPKGAVLAEMDKLTIPIERLLVPTGPCGFRITTKIHPFWNVYFNGLGVAIAEQHEPQRSVNTHSYRYVNDGDGLFDRTRSWRSYREATLNDPALIIDQSVVVQTDISSFYEHIYHHRLENLINDMFPDDQSIAIQVDRFLNKFSSGRSFGLPVGGQCARVLAEVLMSPVDRLVKDEGIVAHRYVDDFTILASSQEEAYRALSVLSNALADYGLSLNRTKTSILNAKHYTDFVKTQLETPDDSSAALRDIDLHFDPYSDNSRIEYSELVETVRAIDIKALLDNELRKGQPDNFLLSQISRTLRFQSPLIAIQLCETLLSPRNLNAFRSSWSTMMRGIAAVRADDGNNEIFMELDSFLDAVPEHSAHLLLPEANCVHYLKTIRFRKTDRRSKFVLQLFNSSRSEVVRKGCIECWKEWRDRTSFTRLRGDWLRLSNQEQRMLWLAAGNLGDEGAHARKQLAKSLERGWALGIEQRGAETFSSLYQVWANSYVA